MLTAVFLISPAPHLPLAPSPAPLRGGGSIFGIINLTVTVLRMMRHGVLDTAGQQKVKHLK